MKLIGAAIDARHDAADDPVAPIRKKRLGFSVLIEKVFAFFKNGFAFAYYLGDPIFIFAI